MKIEIENDKVKLEKVGYRWSCSDYAFSRMVHVANKDGGVDAFKVATNEFRERFARAVAELIIANWDDLVFDETQDTTRAGMMDYSAVMYILKKKHDEPNTAHDTI